MGFPSGAVPDDRPEQTLGDLKTFLTHLMVYGSSADVAIVERYVPREEFRRVLEDAPAGVFTQQDWKRWHERFGMPVPPLPRRRFPDGSMGPEPVVSLEGKLVFFHFGCCIRAQPIASTLERPPAVEDFAGPPGDKSLTVGRNSSLLTRSDPVELPTAVTHPRNRIENPASCSTPLACGRLGEGVGPAWQDSFRF